MSIIVNNGNRKHIGAALEEKLITAMYTNAKINGQVIKLILDSGSAGSIII
ncbi:hypothetical protein G9A89_021794 [Geosiphon pyriformis]|nr:hypothetical protein G9A89_021794 [Geosiphon pyriformis]